MDRSTSKSASRCLRAMTPWRHVVMTPWHHVVMTPWRHVDISLQVMQSLRPNPLWHLRARIGLHFMNRRHRSFLASINSVCRPTNSPDNYYYDCGWRMMDQNSALFSVVIIIVLYYCIKYELILKVMWLPYVLFYIIALNRPMKKYLF